MKRLVLIFLAFFLSLNITDAQTAVQKHNMDTDIWHLRNAAVPSFKWHYDDYLQFGPAAVMMGLKACGYESMSSWGRMLTGDAFSAATMALAVNGIKYSIGRLRPDGTRHNSFPSGHTATAFMTATLLHKEYGWKSPWFSVGGYTAAAVTGVSRILNNRHWMSDVVAGAAIGIGSVHLGYYLSDLIFKERGLNEDYEVPSFCYDPSVRHYSAEVYFGRRFILGPEGSKESGLIPSRGSSVGIGADFQVLPAGAGIALRAGASSLIYSSGETVPLYSMLAGASWNLYFAKRLEVQIRALAGYASCSRGGGADLSIGTALSFFPDSNFKIKVFADIESINPSPALPWINSVVLGYSTAWVW